MQSTHSDKKPPTPFIISIFYNFLTAQFFLLFPSTISTTYIVQTVLHKSHTLLHICTSLSHTQTRQQNRPVSLKYKAYYAILKTMEHHQVQSKPTKFQTA